MPARKTAQATTKSTGARSKRKPSPAKSSKPSASSKSKSGAATTTRKTSKLGRSRIPVDAPLSIIFEDDPQAQAAFQYLGIETVRQLQKLEPDELILRLTSPPKQTVGRIRRFLALNNRCLAGDERFALEVQKQQT